ncbi:MAG: tRNA dihydrouridine synthase DusB [Arenicellales bacterium WSBS_2016_MAG_OTU3]
MQIGSYKLGSNVIAAPMAGVTDQPFRLLCKEMGAGMVVSEMVSSRPELKHTLKTRLRMTHAGESEPIAVQIAGGDAYMLAESARFTVDHGAQIIDINMGCPAKKVCNKAAGSALLSDEKLVSQILEAVVNAVKVPVTLKIRTGPTPSTRNACRIAQIAEQSGIRALAIHGRTRTCKFVGEVEYKTIAAVKQVCNLPVLANGDIDSPQKAQDVLEKTGADAVMIGRAAQGRPWIFEQINHYLRTKEILPDPSIEQQRDILIRHLHSLYAFYDEYGEYGGVRIARKHIGWYLKAIPGDRDRVMHQRLRTDINKQDEAIKQIALVEDYFDYVGDSIENTLAKRCDRSADDTNKLAA